MILSLGEPRWGLGALLISGTVALMPSVGHAQTVPSREQVEAPRPDGQLPPSRVRVNSKDAIEQGPCPLRDSTVTVDIQTVRFEAAGGGEVPAEFLPLLANVRPAITGTQPIAVVCDLRDAANTALRREGYIAGVQVPPQDIVNGELRLAIVAGRITDITVRGDAGRFRDALRPRIEQLKTLFPLNQREVERALLLAGDVPGLDVSLALRSAGTAPGELAGDLNVEATSVLLLANVQNPGSRELGREIGTLRAEAYGLTGLSDLTYLSASSSLDFEEQYVAQIGHEMGIGSSGFRVGGRFNYAQSRPDIEGLNLKTRSIIAGFDLRYPLMRRVTQSVSVGAGFEYINQRTVLRAGGVANPFSQDRISIAYARIDGSIREPSSQGESLWTLDAGIELRQGLDIFNATPRRTVINGFPASRFDGNSQATVVRGTIDASVKLGRYVTITGSALGQWASSALLNIEEFSIGNLTYGRGYDPGSNGADRVIAARIEPRVRIVDAERFRLEAVMFYDNVRIRNLDTNTLEDRRTLSSIGGGVRMAANNRFIVDLIYAKPLKRVLATDDFKPTDRLLFSITTKLLPWRSSR